MADGNGSAITSSNFIIHRVGQGVNTTLERGAFGEITLALEIQKVGGTDQLSFVAIKTVQQSPKKEPDDSEHEKESDEISCLQRLHPHPNIVSLLDVQFSGTNAGLVLPYCPVDLYTALTWKRQTFQPPLTPSTLTTIGMHLFSALKHCHCHDIVHGDVKPGNLLIHVESKTLQLCDFGIAVEKKSSFTNSSMSGNAVSPFQQRQPRALCTLQYRPPEVLLGLSPTANPDPSMDIFSAGISLAECIVYGMLFPGTSDLSQLSLYFQTLGTPTPESWPGVVHLPDWPKVRFTEHPIDPRWYRRHLPRLEEMPNRAAWTNLVCRTIQLDPSQRWSAETCVRELSTQQTQGTVSCEDDSNWVLELVPERLRTTPLLLSPPYDCYQVLDQQIKEVAQTRREFLSALHPWSKYNKRKVA